MKSFNIIVSSSFVPVFDNDLGAFVPEVWAQESLMVLENNTVGANLVHKDFKDEVARHGEVINTRMPGTFNAKRKGVTDPVEIQAATSTNVSVKMDQHLHTSFLIRDGEESKGFKSLRKEYLVPALESVAQGLDRIILGQAYQFIGNSVGKLGTDLSKSSIIDVKAALTMQKCPLAGRSCLVTPNAEGALLEIAEFTNADKIGDGGSTMRDGALGRTMGMDFIMSQNMPVIGAQTTSAESVDNGSGYAAGAVSIAVVDTTVAIPVGSWVTFAGDMTPQQVTASTVTLLTITPGLKHAIVDSAVVTVSAEGAIDNSGGYLAEYAKDITVDGFTISPHTGQLVSTGVGVNYGIINDDVSITSMLLDKPIVETVADSAPLFLGPSGDYCFAFHPNAISLVTRPLAMPANGTGALSYVAEYNGLAVRVTITYNGTLQGHLVTVDLLCGVKVLDKNLGCLLFA